MIIFAQASQGLAEACGESDRGFVCERVFDWTGNDGLATAADWLLDRPIRIALIVVVAWIATRVVRRAIVRFTKRVAAAPSSARLQKLRERGPVKALADADERSRAESRAETLGHVLRSVAVALIWTFALLIVLGEIGVNLGPLIAGAGIGGVALGFGAQSIVKDFLSGLFMLIEDHYGVGDVVDLGYAIGTVEEVSLRSTTIRDVKGTVWHVPNGEIARVGNFSQLWSRALIDVEVAYDTDLRMAMGVIHQVAQEFWEDPEWGGDELAECPDVWGVQYLGSSGIALRVAVKTEPSMQWAVERELRLRLKEAFDEAGIEIPFPQQTLWFRNDDTDGASLSESKKAALRAIYDEKDNNIPKITEDQ
ncbi:MAG: mechanosensitive ion channel family protein [Acidimicrobiaceae bacterium]|nr:mechanosensitive ion channel family protein [Acidimicrobiaceae bacterium]MCY4175428.1 mechanosensitive ion channel family protein [Acidimicrobiaceae bacterium]MCY4279174.1 mechanosensitive ion channel family protein [Acidimicrobiaceae bacterium]MCY4293488.1 mechanosensitive ion channel family protein [Acidimicrobiaceae bacterium]